jgi:hypothetical protein
LASASAAGAPRRGAGESYLWPRTVGGPGLGGGWSISPKPPRAVFLRSALLNLSRSLYFLPPPMHSSEPGWGWRPTLGAPANARRTDATPATNPLGHSWQPDAAHEAGYRSPARASRAAPGHHYSGAPASWPAHRFRCCWSVVSPCGVSLAHTQVKPLSGGHGNPLRPEDPVAASLQLDTRERPRGTGHRARLLAQSFLGLGPARPAAAKAALEPWGEARRGATRRAAPAATTQRASLLTVRRGRIVRSLRSFRVVWSEVRIPCWHDRRQAPLLLGDEPRDVDPRCGARPSTRISRRVTPLQRERTGSRERGFLDDKRPNTLDALCLLRSLRRGAATRHSRPATVTLLALSVLKSATQTTPATSERSSRSHPAALKTRQPRDHRSERHRAVAPAAGSPYCGCSDGARDPRIANGRDRRVPDPKARPERSTGGNARTRRNPPQPAAPTCAANAYASRRNRVLRSSSQPSHHHSKKGGEMATAAAFLATPLRKGPQPRAGLSLSVGRSCRSVRDHGLTTKRSIMSLSSCSTMWQ